MSLVPAITYSVALPKLDRTGLLTFRHIINTSRVYLEKYSGISFPASTSATFYADVRTRQIFSTAFAADVTITMATTRGMERCKFRFVNAGSGGHNLIIKQGVTTLASFAINNFADIQFDGTNWNRNRFGSHMTWARSSWAHSMPGGARRAPEGQQAVAYVIKNRLADGRWENLLLRYASGGLSSQAGICLMIKFRLCLLVA